MLLMSPEMLGMQGLWQLWPWTAAACPAWLGGPGYHYFPTTACHSEFYDGNKSLAYFLHLPVHIAGLVKSHRSEAAVLPDRLLSLDCRI